MNYPSDTKSGLTAAVRASKISLSQAEQTFLDFVKEHAPPKQCPLAGNSVHADKKFLDKYMPQFMDHLHYRIVDVSTIKELCRLVIEIIISHTQGFHKVGSFVLGVGGCFCHLFIKNQTNSPEGKPV